MAKFRSEKRKKQAANRVKRANDIKAATQKAKNIANKFAQKATPVVSAVSKSVGNFMGNIYRILGDDQAWGHDEMKKNFGDNDMGVKNILANAIGTSYKAQGKNRKATDDSDSTKVQAAAFRKAMSGVYVANQDKVQQALHGKEFAKLSKDEQDNLIDMLALEHSKATGSSATKGTKDAYRDMLNGN